MRGPCHGVAATSCFLPLPLPSLCSALCGMMHPSEVSRLVADCALQMVLWALHFAMPFNTVTIARYLLDAASVAYDCKMPCFGTSRANTVLVGAFFPAVLRRRTPVATHRCERQVLLRTQVPLPSSFAAFCSSVAAVGAAFAAAFVAFAA